ncbi:MAG: HAMP domain-containing histidine kinase [Chloroflexi bacterium]|nr:HAMP domain-containing histidine kinase [Chloroflexota bacterium]
MSRLRTLLLRTDSLWIRLVGALVLIVLFSIAAVVLLISHATIDQFVLYTTQTGQQRAAQLAPVAADYFTRSGNWAGVEEALLNPWAYRQSGGAMMGGRMAEGMGAQIRQHEGEAGGMHMSMGLSDRILIAGSDGRVEVDTGETLLGSPLTAAELARGVPIIGESGALGTLIITPLDSPATPAGDFLNAINRAALLAGIGAAGLALLLGSLLFMQISRPLRRLASAGQGIAGGDLTRRVSLNGHDEIASVARTFNQMAETLQHYETERRNMIGDIAHELRTPLSIIQSNVEAMLDGMLPTSPEELQSLHQETLRLNRLITDLRTLSLAESGQLRLQTQPVRIDDLAQQVWDRMAPRAREKSITLRTSVAADLPPVQGDFERLMQIMTNLVDNALRYSPNESVVIIEGRAEGGAVKLSVSDSGPGIPPEEIPHLFERFWRSDKSRSRTSGGSGLGLAIVRQLAELHGGTVQVESKLGQGARFTLCLPTT